MFNPVEQFKKVPDFQSNFKKSCHNLFNCFNVLTHPIDARKDKEKVTLPRLFFIYAAFYDTGVEPLF